MLYDRKIKYLDYYENGERVSGSGFAKLEVREGVLRLEINVKGLYPTDTFTRDVVLRGADAEVILGQIEIQEGNGLFCYSCQIEQDIGNTGISCEKLQEIKIPIGGSREIVCSLSTVPERVAAVRQIRSVEQAEEARQTGAVHQIEEARQTEAVYQIEEVHQIEEVSQTEKVNKIEEVHQEKVVNLSESAGKMDDQAVAQVVNADRVESASPAETAERVDVEDTRRTIELHSTNVSRTGEPQPRETQRQESQPGVTGKKAAKLLEDKWMQLSAIYPHIQPFGDDRDYLSLNPSDFVVFPAKNYKAVNNSFLLHGYYNYHHLILARVERRGQIFYYIGVPGNYYDREKQVAIMFGFESFECESEPAKTGDFGYYMMRTEL